MLTLVVAAAALNNGIGVNNDLPWRLPTDLAYFNNVTRTTTSTTAINACIMGRRTWLSVPRRFRPLDNRYNIVITRDTHLLDKELPPNSIALPSIASALAHIEQINSGQVPLDGGLLRIDKVFVCGGRAIYEEAMGMPGVCAFCSPACTMMALVAAIPSSHRLTRLCLCHRHMPAWRSSLDSQCLLGCRLRMALALSFCCSRSKPNTSLIIVIRKFACSVQSTIFSNMIR
ncbi:dihydrofolate reductase-like domain-containing protein [Kickxella alabastrina]|uniref:dihydrofolate reductase-like domain-containing protein n=1 Tax=Kickxella alabastrina TaxID=61397 RepID=UPI00221F7C8D|nr:dihydrofolate reductase-like domain-containing protein [Kickxella alabastrina]KAI7830062.1 dihydrofolate reductase-like domain-containing protein [Kickxella alabastrina]